MSQCCTTVGWSILTCEDDKAETVFTTPKALRFKDALDTENLQTPKRLVKVVGRPLTPRLVRTPSTPARSQSIYSSARQLFSQSSSSQRLVGRESERHTVESFLTTNIEAIAGGCLYISGPPGTGKSALLDEVLTNLQPQDHVKFTQINCVSIKTSKDIYSKLLEDLSSASVSSCKSPEVVLSNLFIPKAKKDGNVYIVILDEIDHLTSDFDILEKLFEWALTSHSRLTLIGIANALDLTDRFLPQLKSRNLKPELLPFQPYNASQISSIITKRLQTLLPADCKVPDFVPFMHPAAIQLCAKKVASQTGDLRKAFSIVRRAIDLIEKESLEKEEKAMASAMSPSKSPLMENINIASPNGGVLTPPFSSPLRPSESTTSTIDTVLPIVTIETAPRVSIAHIARISSTIFNNGTIQRLGGLNLQQKAVLCSLVAMEKKRLARMKNRDPFSTPSKSANVGPPTVREMFEAYCELCKRDHVLHPLSVTEFRDVVAGLETLGLVNESKGKLGSFKVATMTTPTRTPSKLGRGSAEEKQMCSAVTEKEINECIQGPGMEILRSLLTSDGL